MHIIKTVNKKILQNMKLNKNAKNNIIGKKS